MFPPEKLISILLVLPSFKIKASELPGSTPVSSNLIATYTEPSVTASIVLMIPFPEPVVCIFIAFAPS